MERIRKAEREPSIIVDYDIFYTNPDHDPEMKSGWYFWFIDQYGEIVSEPIGPWNNPDKAMRIGKVAVKVYYDHDDEEWLP